MYAEIAALFSDVFGSPPEVLGAAPGRIEFIGNHTDYNGGKVLGAAIDRHVKVAVSRRADRQVHLRSVVEPQPVECSLDALRPLESGGLWANYPLGVLVGLMEAGMEVPTGLNLLVTSDLPTGAGLSSSAAIELATAMALCGLHRFSLPREHLVALCRRAENHFVGMPCGILDQGVSCFGEPDHLVLIDCRDLTFTTVPLPPGVHFWIFNTNVKHRLVESLYALRHRECMEAFERLQAVVPGATCLGDLSPAEVLEHRSRLPGDLYPRALHVAAENRRVTEAVGLLRESDLTGVGKLLYASHESSRSLFENSRSELDTFVSLLRGRPHVYGARLTGGGFGGAVMALTSDAFSDSHAAEVAAAFSARFDNCCPAIFHVRTGRGASWQQA